MQKIKIMQIFLVLILVFAVSGQCQETAAPGTAAGAGHVSDKITLDIKGMDILDVLKILSMKSGLNIVAGKNVTGRVTIYLKDVNVWDALEIVLVANNLAYEKQGNIINIMTDRDYELIYGEKFYDKKRTHVIRLKYAKAAEVSKALMQVKTNIGKVVVDEGSNTLVLVDTPASIFQMKDLVEQIDVPTETKIFYLRYAKAEDIEKKITELVTKNLGIIKVDARTNSIVVTDTPQQLTLIEKVVTTFDKKDAQVMIEAKILEVTLNDNFQMGVDWDMIAHKYFKATQTLKLGLTQGGTLKIGTLAGGGSPTDPGDYSSLIEALREVGDVNTLSSPRIMALNNQESKILVGKKEPYSTKSTVINDNTTTAAETVTFVDLGVKLYVTPTINEDGFVTMKIKPEVSTKSDTYTTADKNTIPIISTTEAETTIAVRDNATVVIAGLIKDTLDKKYYKIPLLGDLPVLGRVFSNITDKKKKEEIVVLLTPHIVTGESTFDEVSRWHRYEEGLNKVKDRVEKEEEALKKQRQKAQVASKKPQEIKKPVAERPKKQPVVKREQEAAKKAKPEVPKAKPEEPKVALRLAAEKAAVKEAAFTRNDHDSYFLSMKKKIYDNIRTNFSTTGLKGEGTVSFVVNADGNLQGEPLITAEDSKEIGDTLSEAVKLASPFGNFPPAFDAQSEKFMVSVSFK